MPVFDAPSISCTSVAAPARISRQASHVMQGDAVGPFAQFSARARILANVVFPTPRVPEKRYAWWILPIEIALARARVTCPCPTTSSNPLGRHFLASASYAMRLRSPPRPDPLAGVRRQPGEPPAHGAVRLPLLPSGPDGICRLPLRRAWPPAHPRRGTPAH